MSTARWWLYLTIVVAAGVLIWIVALDVYLRPAPDRVLPPECFTVGQYTRSLTPARVCVPVPTEAY